MIGQNYVNEAFVKRSLIFSIMTMVLMAGFLSVFLPTYDSALEEEMTALTGDYYRMTGQQPTSEEIWGLTGIYTPYGIGADGRPSSAWGVTPDQWLYGSRILSHTPTQYNDVFGSRESFTVQYDADTGLYYYTAAGEDLAESVTVPEPDPETGDIDPQKGTLYTAVTMDADKSRRSDMFFTPGSRHETDRGIYYEFTGWRYAFQPLLRDYKAADNVEVDRTTTSLSMVWYSYYGDTGISSQLMLSGSDSGVAYITGDRIVQAFDKASYTAKFDQIFNGLTMHIYIRINPAALQEMSVQDCYDNGYWSVMVTSPSATQDSSGLTLSAFSPDRLLDVIIHLLTFDMGAYGLSGVAATLASVFFAASFYTSLIAISLSVWPVAILAGALAIFQTIAAGFNLFG